MLDEPLGYVTDWFVPGGDTPMESVIAVHPLENFHLELRFNTGETRLFDARPYLGKGVFRRLQDKELFNPSDYPHVASQHSK